MDSTAAIDDRDFQMDDSAAYGQNFKRRRCGDDDMGMGQMISTNPFIPINNNHNQSPFGSSSFGGSAMGEFLNLIDLKESIAKGLLFVLLNIIPYITHFEMQLYITNNNRK